MQVVKFKYYDEFNCTGSECRDCCCKDWRIDLSKREYLNYKKLDCSPKLREIIDNAFVRLKDPEAEKAGFYVKMKLKEDGHCPFHDTDGLCMLQKELGASALGRVCNIFPRLQTKIGNDVYIFACALTCSHVIEILMKHPEGLEIIEKEYDGKNKYINKGMYLSRFTPSSWKSLPYFWIIKNAELDILQNRNFNIKDRLLILGFFCKKADEHLKNNEGQKLDSLYKMMSENEFCKNVAESLTAPQSNDEAAIKSMDIFFRMYNFVTQDEADDWLKNVFHKVYDHLNVESGTKTDENGQSKSYFIYNKERYNDNKECFSKIESDRPHILENILVNQAFIMSPAEGIFKNYFTLVVFYNTLKICVPTFLKEGYTDSDLAIAFTNAAKMILNTNLAEGGAVNSFIQSGSFDLPHAAFLIS